MDMGKIRIDRRTAIVASSVGYAGMRLPSAATASPGSPATRSAGKAKSTILFFLCGGASHVDTWDMKPDAGSAYRGPFASIQTAAAGIRLCEHLPMTAKVADHLAIVHGVSDRGRATGDHHAGYYYNLTGHAPDNTFRTQGNDRRPYADDWPFMGSVVASRREPHESLPQAITLPHKPSRPPYTRPGQFSARLGAEFDPFYLSSDPGQPLTFQAPSLTLQDGVTRDRLSDRKGLLKSIDGARRTFETHAGAKNFEIQHRKAFELLASTATSRAFDVSEEPLAVRERYGQTVNGTSLLMARRLVQAGVPFVTVFWKEDTSIQAKCKSAGGWDTHGNNFQCLQENLLPEFDRCYSALLEDLAQSGLIDDTLVLVSSEMGRKPKIGDVRSGGVVGAGRDHWTACMSNLFAGGGIRGGQIFGGTDKRGEYPEHQTIGPEDIVKTVYKAMGVNDLSAIDASGQPISLLAEGEPLHELF
ncbi:hypothetical protein EC9_35240 [Rosistilla ulvae]|uniref:Sulfatase n=2 Tax=Rosistilla ulvae TaxID=1930277 RepID=A0A517M385_9BACT|nr:hypothetical protein EC9_35240 [Rosistilla ulvae]